MVLAEFRTWLLENPIPEPDAEAITLDRVLEQFTALRQEVNLQTKASRAQLEQNSKTLQNLDEALEELRQRDTSEEELERQEEERLRPLLKSVIEVHDHLLRANRETQKVRDTLTPLLADLTQSLQPAPPPVKRSWWSNWLGPAIDEKPAMPERLQQVGQVGERIGRVLEGILAGYKISLEKVEKVLRSYGLEAVPAEGESYDPEQMEVLEAVPNSGRPNNVVLDEVRRGYRWRGRVFRYALVRVAKD